jgi:hypothetical protein
VKKLNLLFYLTFACAAQAQKPTEKYLRNQSNTHDEAVAFYAGLDARFGNASLLSCGTTDSGRPLHLFVISAGGDTTPASVKAQNKAVLLISNGIHAGEPDGIDASMKLAEDLLTDPAYKKLLENTVVCIIPVLNVDGSLVRGCCSRVNQDGPENYGFRANYQNLDLNRDFIKCDALTTQTFHALFRAWDPDVFIDTHVSDGADYPYAMTLIATHHDKMEKSAGQYLRDKMTPSLYKSMEEKKIVMCPYVNTMGETPDQGLLAFFETPRFATGYASLFNTFSFVTESHMLKPFRERVEATYAIEKSILEFTNANAREIRSVRAVAGKNCAAQKSFALQWKPDTAQYELISFSGYEAKYKTSNVTGQQRLYYDRQAPYEKKIRFYDTYHATVTIEKPYAYVVPQCWRKVIDQLRINNIPVQRLEKDTSFTCEVYYLEDYSTTGQAYEGHHLHGSVTVRRDTQKMNFFKGDYVVVADRPENRFIVETLEPQGVDSYFAWGFFDAVLQEKEYFSAYVFEEIAEELLKDDPALKKEIEEKRHSDLKFAGDAEAQLYFIYQRSRYFEKSYKRYPVARIPQRMNLPAH